MQQICEKSTISERVETLQDFKHEVLDGVCYWHAMIDNIQDYAKKIIAKNNNNLTLLKELKQIVYQKDQLIKKQKT